MSALEEQLKQKKIELEDLERKIKDATGRDPSANKRCVEELVPYEQEFVN